MDSPNQLPRGDHQRLEAGPGAAGWTRRDTSLPVAATYEKNPRDGRGLEGSMIALAKARAHLIVASSLELYREITLSALSLVRRS